MSVAPGSVSERELRFQAVAAEYLEAREAGRTDELSALLARHPDLADAIAAFVADQDELAHLAAPLRDAVAPAPLPGQAGLPSTLGDFRIMREVGRGGMGVVYEAEQVSLGRRVALKVLPFAATMDPRHLQRFHNEARAAAGLHHTNIVPVFGVGSERGVHYYAMQFIDGRTLADLIAEQRGEARSQVPTMAEAEAAASATTAPPAAQATSVAPRDAAYFRRVAEWGIQAAEALDCAHQQGVVHRDVKPANLLVDAAGRLWVTDFGLAQVQSDSRLTMTGDLVGTLRYMSPEQALAKRVVIDHRTDVYSLGATLYELLTLRPAFTGADRQELLRQIAFEDPRPPRWVNKAIPVELETIVLKALEKNPTERYATAQEMADDLGRYLRDEPTRARRPSLARRARKWARRHRPAVMAGAVCLLVTLVASVGSASWVLGERASRQDRVREALAAAEPGLREGNPYDPALTGAAQRAEAQLGGGLVGQDLRRRVEQLHKDVRMLGELERIRLDQAGLRDGHFDRAGSVPQYARAFREYGIDVEALGLEEAAALVQASAIREHLVAGLDDWADGIPRLGKAEPSPKARQLLAIARQVDPDPWRNRLRELLLSGDARELEQLARSAPVEELPAATLGLLGHRARDRATASAPMVELLRRGQRRFPADFWTNHNLALALAKSQQPQLEEAIGFYRAAVALRPQSPGVHVNLGAALHDKGDLDGAIAECREALRLKSEYAGAHHNLGRALAAKKNLDEAITKYRQAIALDPNLAAFVHYDLGAALYHKQDLDGAIAEYRQALRLKEDDPEAHNGLGAALSHKGQLEEAIAKYRQALRLKEDFPEAHNNLGNALEAKGQLDEAITEYRHTIRLNKDYAEAHANLGAALSDKGQLEEAIAEYRAALHIKPDYPEAHSNLGNALKAKGQLDEAITEYRQALRLNKDYAEAHDNLGVALFGKGDIDRAIAEHREALRINQDCAIAHNNLGVALYTKGQLDEAIAEYRAALRIKDRPAALRIKDAPVAHYNLGVALYDKGQLEEAIAEYRLALRINKDFPQAYAVHSNIGDALQAKGQLDEAIAEYREAIQLKKDDPEICEAHYNLGNALKAKGQLDEAITEYRHAIRLNKDFAKAHCNLAHILRDQGQFADALKLERRGHELGSKDPSRWPYPSAQWVKQCERLVELDGKLPAILKGQAKPADVAERVDLAWICTRPSRQMYGAATLFCAEVLAADPRLSGAQPSAPRYDAACAAALAGCGQGKDVDSLGEEEFAYLRRRALAWLRDDLAAWRRVLDQHGDKARPAVAGKMAHWLQDSDFAGVRGPEALARFPEPERQQWQKLWAEVADTLARAKGQAVPEKKPSPK
jgi:tetratricopeptide (TPR) repeat protein